MVLTITSITDEQQAGVPYKTRRIKGTYSGALAYVEQERGGYKYRIAAQTTQLKGSFDVVTSLQ